MELLTKNFGIFFFSNYRCVATSILSMRLLHVVAFFKEITLLAQTKVLV